MPANTPLIALSSLVALLLVFVTPRLSFFQTILISPLVITTGVFAIIAFLVASATASDRHPSPSIATRRRRALRALTFTTPSAWSAVLTRQSWEQTVKSSTSPTRLDSVLQLIRQSFILPWYSRISPSPAFPTAVDGLIRHVLADVTKRSESVDWPSLIVSKILPRITDHLHHYRSVEHLSPSSTRPAPNPALPLPLPAKPHPALSPQLHLAAGTSSPSIEAHFRQILARIIVQILPETERSEVVQTAVREVVLGAVLLPTFEMLCESDFWNRQIDDKGGRYLYEQKQVNKFLSALSTLPHPASSPVRETGATSRNLPPASSISAHSSSRQFDAFIRSIPKLKTLGEARRLRADVERELRQARTSLAEEEKRGVDGRDGDRPLRRASNYVDRLDRARKDIDARIAALSGGAGSSHLPTASVTTLASVNLYAVLADPSSLAYWLEYMDRRGRSRLVQFWLTVEGFKDPLEAAGQNSALESTAQLAELSSGSTETSTLVEDAAFLREMYFSGTTNTVEIPARHLKTIQDFDPVSMPLSSTEARQIKHAIFASQKAVYEQMEEEDWADFRKSELYLKAVTDLGRNAAPPLIKPETSSYDPPPPPIHPKRVSTAPPGQIRRATEPHTPLRTLPSLVAGNFAPASPLIPAASISTSSPSFDRPLTGSRLSSVDTRKVIDVTHTKSKSPSPVPSTPPIPQRAMTQLDFLIGEPVEAERTPLFDDDEDNGTPGIDDDDDDDFVQIQRMEAIQAALTSIIASDDLANSQTLGLQSPEVGHGSMSSSLVLPSRSADKDREKMAAKLLSRSVEDLRKTKPKKAVSSMPASRITSNTTPSAVSMSESRTSSNAGNGKPSKIFLDDEIDEDEVDVSDTQEEPHDVLQLAAPGDLRLSVEIARLQDKIQDLVKQDHLLDTLIRQAELTGNQNELRILLRSQSSIRREQRTAIFQKASFEQQEEENRLVPGRTMVTIPSAVMTLDENDSGKQVVRYTIEVGQLGEDRKVVLSWVVARRYNEFWELDRALREWAHAKGDTKAMEDLRYRVAEMPGKKLVTNLSAGFVEARRLGLEKYLQSLVSSSAICDSDLLRSFLSRSPVPLGNTSEDPIASSTASLSSLAPHNIVKSLYKTMAGSLDDAGLGPSMLDLMSQTLSRQVQEVAEGFGGFVGINGEDLVGMGSSLLPSTLKAGVSPASWIGNGGTGSTNGSSKELANTIKPLGGETGLGSFTAPICDLFIEVFDLKENNWLRRQAIVIILQQVLGGTVERKFRDTSRNILSSESMDRMLGAFQETMWPDGNRRPPSVPRTETEKDETRLSASKKLGLLIPDVAANMIGRGNARRAARRVFGALQDQRLNQQLMLCILDEIFQALFPPV